MSVQYEFVELVKRGDVDRVKALLKEEPELSAARDELGVSAIMLAKYYGQNGVLEELLKHRILLDIFEAAALGQKERVAELAAAKPALVNYYSPIGFTPLGLAAFFGYVEVLERLLAHG